MSLAALSDDDLRAIAAGDLSKVSEKGLRALAGQPVAETKEKKPDLLADGTLNIAGFDTGIKMPRAVNATLTNLGSGVADLVLGAKQIAAQVTGNKERDAELRREGAQKRALDEELANTSFDMPFGKYAAKGLQVAGATAPTLLIPAGGAVQSGRLLPLALRSAGVGAAMGALNPVADDESRTTNMLSSAALSAAFPVAAAGVNSVRRMVTQSGGAERAGEQIARELAGEGGKKAQGQVLRQTLDRLRDTTARSADDIPLSTAAQLSDAQLARLEAGSRARNGANWYDFDQNQARAVADQFNRATSSADDLAARRALRQRNIETNKSQAFASVNTGAFGNELGRFRSNLDVAMRSPEASNPAVRNMLQSVADEIDRLGDGFGPEHLATIRANLSGKYNPISPNAYAAAPRDSVATRSVLQEVDNILNQATNSRWQNVVSGYARDSAQVDAAKAAGRLREAFYDPATGRVKGVSADTVGDIPKITEAGLGRAMNTAVGPDKALLLSPEANTRLENILAALRKQNIVQGVKRSATAGGGSNTASDQFAARAASDAADVILGTASGPAAPVARGALQSLRSFADAKKDAALAEALQNPERMIAIIEEQLKRGQPLTPQMEAFMRIVSGAPAAAYTAQQ